MANLVARRCQGLSRRACQDCRAETEEITEPSSILYTAPKDEKEEAEQLAIVMRESLQHESTNSTAAFPFLENDRYSSYSAGPVLGYPTPCYPFYNYEMARMNYTQSLYEPRPTDTCTLTTSTSSKPVFIDSAPSSESQAKPSAEEAANLLLSLSQRNQRIEED